MSGPTPAPPSPRDRAARLEALRSSELDALVVGGGITGLGLALDLRLRGLRVAVVERGDWAGGTSSASSRLIHGGLRYLEQLELGLVRESCLERGLLLTNAAGLVWPERFTFPLRRGGPVGRAKLAAGLWLYTAVSLPRALGWPRLLGARAVERAFPGVDVATLAGGGRYLDGATDDARLALAVMRSARRAGALTLSRVEARALEGGASGVAVELEDRLAGERFELRARCAVLAGGPWTDALRGRAGLSGRWVAPTRGTHLLVPRERLPTDGAVILNSPLDGRVMFLIPRPRTTLVGTTDLDACADAPVRATAEEVRYLLASVNGWVPGAELAERDVLSTYAGLRPLLASDASDARGASGPSERSREERVACDGRLYTIAGGKLTGYRAMAEGLGARVAHDLGLGSAARRSPTRDHPLEGALPDVAARPGWSALEPGGRAPHVAARDALWLPRYGANVERVQRVCREAGGGCEELAPDTLLGEVDWAAAQEDCLRAADFLFRRTDLGLAARPAAEAAAERVVARLAERFGWDAARRDAELEHARRAIAERHAWRAA